MTDPDFLDLARDVGDSIASLAEPAVGGSRWETRDYAGEPFYSTDVFAGMTGTTVFLADLFAVTDDQRYRDLADGGAQWVETESRHELTAPEPNLGLHFGVAGHGTAFLRLYATTGRQRWLDLARTRARRLHTPDYSMAELLYGAAGGGIFLLRLHRATGDDVELQAVVRTADWVLDRATVDDGGTHWVFPGRRGDVDAIGLAHGTAGVAHFLAGAYAVSGEDRFREAVQGAVRWIEAQTVDTSHGPGWPRWPDDDQDVRFQWCHGAPGIGLFAIHAAAALDSRELRELALRCGEATHRAGDIRANPSQCHGLAGNGELFIELARATDDPVWLERAREFGRSAAGYREEADGRARWRGDEPGNFSPDFMLGSAGLGHFFLRLARPDDVEMPFMAPQSGATASS